MSDWYDLLERGRAALESHRLAEAEKRQAEEEQRLNEMLATWEPCQKAAVRDVPPELLEYSNILETPDDWTQYRHEFTLRIECPMCSPIHAHYVLAKGMTTGGIWIRCSGDLGKWSVTTYMPRCDRQTGFRREVVEVHGWHKVPDLFHALALAEEAEQERQRLQDEADAMNAMADESRAEPRDAWDDLSLEERRLAVQLLHAHQAIVSQMVRGDAIAYREDE